jgi:5-hmdU DNA kinase, helical domain
MEDNVEWFVKFILERHAVYRRREAGKPWPWTRDPILREYKFCNVFREKDRVTRWISKKWRKTHADDPDFWFAALVARRCINWPDTLAAIGYPVPWDPDRFLCIVARCRKAKQRVFNSEAYKLMVSGQPGDLADLQVRHVLDPMWEDRQELRPRRGDTLQDFYERLAPRLYMGTFYAGQVIADAKYVGVLQDASDWWSFAAPGPGSERGLNRVLGRPTNAPWTESEWLRQLRQLRKEIKPRLCEAGLPRMHAQDTQDCLCEFDKYERIRLGEGKGRKFIRRFPRRSS